MAMTSGRNTGHLPRHLQRKLSGGEERCTDFDDVLHWAFSGGDAAPPADWCMRATRFGDRAIALLSWPGGTPIADEQDAWRLLAKMADSHHGKRDYSVHRKAAAGLGPQQAPDGSWVAVCRVGLKDEGRAEIEGRIQRGEPLSFNPAGRRARGRYICRTSIGGCGHRRAAQPETLCTDCAASRQDRGYEQALRYGASQDVRVWQLDAGLKQPATPAEHEHLARRRAEQQRSAQAAEQQPREPGQLRDAWRNR